MAQPSLLERTMTGLLFKLGLNTRSQLTKKLLPSTSANSVGLLIAQTVNDICNDSPKANGHVT